MPPLLETMARSALLARLERVEQTAKTQAQVISYLVAALWHHLQDRHDAAVGTADDPDVVAVRNARRVIARTSKTDVAAAAKADIDRGRPRHNRNRGPAP